jgi:maltooligosyltrehalose trehalohydrolase
MDREADGWWSVEASELGPGRDYAFALDGDEPRPDPRAQRLPHGVHGPGQTVDHSAFPWADGDWQAPALADGIVYELHVGTFTPAGTFEGVMDRLDYLRDLGVTHVELMPVHSFPGRFGWGYDSVGLFAPQESYGGPEALKRLVDAAHRSGLAMILDVVYNHFGPEGNYLDQFGPYRTDRFQTPWGPAVNLGDRGADEVRRFLIDNALSWLDDYHFDALRLDAVHALVDLTATHFLEELALEVDALGERRGRRLTLIAESDLNDPRLLRGREAGGYGIDAQWSDDFHHGVHVALTGEREGYYRDFEGLPDVARALEKAWVYEGQFSPARGRRHGRPADGLAANRFLGYLQNHDQVGNRARGERMAALVDQDRLRVGAALVLTAPFVPMLFAGEEWGASTPFQFFGDYADTGLRDAVREGRRREVEAFGWDPADVPDPTDEATFLRSKLDWSEIQMAPHSALLDWHRRLIALRKSVPILRDGTRPAVEIDVERGLLAARRPGVDVLVNLGGAPASVATLPSADEVIASERGVGVADGQAELPGGSVAIVVASSAFAGPDATTRPPAAARSD